MTSNDRPISPELSPVNRVASTAHAVIDQAAAKAAPAYEKAQEKVDALQNLKSEWIDNGRAVVRDHPLASLAVGFFVGWVLAKLARD